MYIGKTRNPITVILLSLFKMSKYKKSTKNNRAFKILAKDFDGVT